MPTKFVTYLCDGCDSTPCILKAFVLPLGKPYVPPDECPYGYDGPGEGDWREIDDD